MLGAGPAGMSAALWLHNLGLECLVLEAAERAGGMQNFNFLANEWVIGQQAVTGPELAERFARHLHEAGLPLVTRARLDRIETLGNGFIARYDDITRTFDAILIATGTRYRAEETLRDLPGFEMLPPGRVAYGPHAFSGMDTLAGLRVLIVGGGDNAYENARFLATEGAETVIAMRSVPRAQRGLESAVAALVDSRRCRILTETRISGFGTAAGRIQVEVLHLGKPEVIEVDRIHVLTGYEPNTPFIGEAFNRELAAGIALDNQGYVRVDGECRTSVPRIYAAGDVANPAFPCVVSAVAQGALAAKTMEHDLREEQQ